MASYSFDPRVEAAIARAAQQYGVPVEAMRAVAKIESGGNPMAKNPSSSAGGLFQQIDSNAKAYGVSNRFDPDQSAMGAARFMKDNYTGLQGTLGRAPTTGELYLAHQQGLGGAKKLLTNPNAPASQIVGKAAANLNAGSGLTAGQLAEKWMSKANNLVGQAPVAPAVAGQATNLAASQTAASALPTVAAGTGIPALAAANQATAAAASAPASDPMGGIFSLLMQASQQPAPAPVPTGGGMSRPKAVDQRTEEEKMASVSQTPNVYLDRLRRRV